MSSENHLLDGKSCEEEIAKLEDQLPEELANLYDPDEVFKFDATPEEAARALLRPFGDTGI